jgi:hypothetical protein
MAIKALQYKGLQVFDAVRNLMESAIKRTETHPNTESKRKVKIPQHFPSNSRLTPSTRPATPGIDKGSD